MGMSFEWAARIPYTGAMPADVSTARSDSAYGTDALFTFDVISPFAYLAHELLLREPLARPLAYRPVLFAGLLAAHGQKGPAEIEGKRRFTYRHCTWLGGHLGIPFSMPSHHPFNPIRYLRLIVAMDNAPDVITETFRSLFASGMDPGDDTNWRALCAKLGVTQADADECIADAAVKQTLRGNTDAAIAAGVFGVPTLTLDGQCFWGLDAIPMARAFLSDPTLFDSPAMRAADGARIGAQRPR